MSEISPEANESAEREFNDGLAQEYFEIWDTFPIQRYTNAIEQQLLASVVEPSSRVLVLGVGGGRELPVLLEKGCRIVAVDLSPEMLRIGRERFGNEVIEWRKANVAALPADLTGFDCVIGFGGVMNYQLDLAATLRHLFDRIESRGLLVFDSFNRDFPGERDEQISRGRVRRSYSVSQLEHLCLSTGFQDVEITGHRFLVDQLDARSNRDPHHPGRATLMQLLEVEMRLDAVMPTEKAKLLVSIARRTETLNA